MNEVIRPSFIDFRPVLSCLSQIYPKNLRRVKYFGVRVLTTNAKPFHCLIDMCLDVERCNPSIVLLVVRMD